MNSVLRRSLLFSLLFPLLLSSCGPKESDSAANDSTQGSAGTSASYLRDSTYYDTLSKNPAPLTGGANSTDAIAAAVLEGLAKNDTTALKNLLITRDEYFTIIYPELGRHWPGARDMRPEIIDVLWSNHAGNSMKGLRRALRDLGGMQLQAGKVEFTGGTKEYVSYRIHEGTAVTVRRKDKKEYKIGAIGSIVEKDGVFKLLSYRDREAE